MQADRLIVHRGNALELREAVALHELSAPDVVISGIPFSTMSRSTGAKIIESVTAVLRPGGCFVAYQISAQVHALASPLLGAAQVAVEFLNIPPMRIYRWQKDANVIDSPSPAYSDRTWPDCSGGRVRIEPAELP